MPKFGSIKGTSDASSNSASRTPWAPITLTSIAAAGLLGLIIYSLASASSGSAAFQILAVGLATAAATSAVGCFLGFLFAIPKSAQVGDVDAAGNGYTHNTNLEQISDWLTKILIGVSLVEIGNAGPPARRLIHSLGQGLGDNASARDMAAAIVIIYVIWGFLVAYLVTRTRAAKEFHDGDIDTIVAKVSDKIANKPGDEGMPVNIPSK
jgi:hypothetical protein